MTNVRTGSSSPCITRRDPQQSGCAHFIHWHHNVCCKLALQSQLPRVIKEPLFAIVQNQGLLRRQRVVEDVQGLAARLNGVDDVARKKILEGSFAEFTYAKHALGSRF